MSDRFSFLSFCSCEVVLSCQNSFASKTTDYVVALQSTKIDHSIKSQQKCKLDYINKILLHCTKHIVPTSCLCWIVGYLIRFYG